MVWVHKAADPYVVGLEFCHKRFEAIGFAGEIPSVIRGQLDWVIRYQRALVRFYRVNQRHKTGIAVFFGPCVGIAFNVEFDVRVVRPGEQLRKVVDIGRADMAHIGSWMNRNALRACFDADYCGFNNTGYGCFPRIPKQCNLVQVDREGSTHSQPPL